MPDDFEDRLRRALEQRAARVTPAPDTWRKVEARLQRERSVRLGIAGGAVAVVTLLAVPTLAPLRNRTRVDIASAPGAEQSGAPETTAS